ncbi:MAG: ABC transporter substrate binding protein [Methylococcales bacterium]
MFISGYFLKFKRIQLTLILTMLGVCNVCFAQSQKVLIVANANDGAYVQVINGFKTQLSATSHATYIEIIKPSAEDIPRQINQNKPDLIFTVGSDATTLVQQHANNIPVISTLVLNDRIFKPANRTGVSLNYSLVTQIQWLKKFLPEQTRIAVLFNSAENAQTVQKLKKIAEQAGLWLTAIPVETPRELPSALEQLTNNIDVLLTIPDEIALSPATIKEVMLASFRNRIPLVGLSENWVKSGALYALTWDYDDLGRQCAVQAEKLLSGQVIKNIPPETPRKVSYALNTKIAEHMNIAIPNELIQKAKATFN